MKLIKIITKEGGQDKYNFNISKTVLEEKSKTSNEIKSEVGRLTNKKQILISEIEMLEKTLLSTDSILTEYEELLALIQK